MFNRTAFNRTPFNRTLGAVITASATLSGAGTLAAAAKRTRAASATPAGTGTLATTAIRIRTAAAAPAGAGTLTATAIVATVQLAAASLAGVATLATIARSIRTVTAALAAAGTIAASAVAVDVTAALLAAQKARRRQPYVEVRINELHQGVKRLSWTRLYTGAEADSHHGIAFDGNGDMHRIRVSGTTLYRQKITAPDDSSDYSSWTAVTTDCQGPCAIAAYGSRVYIFYRQNSVNQLRKFYSHNYGSSWTDAVLVSYTDVLSMAATWWGTTSAVICFALKAAEINGIRVDTDTQGTNQHTKAFTSGVVITNTYGIGATYDPFWPECPIVFAARQSDTPYSHFNIFRTWFSDLWTFGALESFIMSPDGESFTFEYPDCHRPQPTAESYETTRVTLVEKFTGTSSYTRPLTCHMVPGTYWSDTTYTEPRPFLNVAPAYGLRIQSTTDYYWLSMPAGVWRAPRILTAPLVISDDITSVAAERPGSLVLELDNSDARYASPGAGDLASLRFRAQIELRLGYRTTYGNLTATAGTFWIDAWQYSSDPNISRFTITAIDAWALMREWTPRFQLRWNHNGSPCTVWQVMYRILARTGIKLTDSNWPRSTAIDNFYPDFTITPGTPGTRALSRLLSMVPDRLVIPGTYAFTKNPLVGEATSYVYSPAIHQLLTGKFTHAVTTSWARAAGRDASANRIVAHAFDWTALADAIDILDLDYDPNLDVATRLQERANAMLRLAALDATPATITAPPSLFAELLDVVEITDPRCGVASDRYRILALRADYHRRKHRYDQTLTMRAP